MCGTGGGGLNIYIKIADILLSNADEECFYNTFGNICDQIYVEHIIPSFQESDSMRYISKDEYNLFRQPVVPKDVCTFLFTRFVIHSDGSVVACCIDWKSEILLGDAKIESLYDIWNGKKLRDLRIIHLSRKRKEIPLCSKCDFHQTGTIDNIDGYAEKILDRLLVR